MWTISNLLSFCRLLLAVPFGVLLVNNHIYSALIIAVVAIGTDLADGYLARKLNQISEVGKVIDPLADKVFVGTAVICLVVMGRLPLWFVIAVLLRDVLILSGGLYAQRKIGKVIPSNYVGKFTVLILSIVLVGVTLGLDIALNYGIYVALGAMILSLCVYGIQMMEKVKKSNLLNNDNSDEK